MNWLNRMASLAILTVAGLSLACPTLAQATADTKPAEAAKPKEQEPPKRDQKALDYEKAIKDLEKVDGPFTVYRRKNDILLEIPEDKLNQLFYVQVTFDTGISQMAQAGDPLNWMANDVYMFQREGDEVWLVRPNTKYRWGGGNELAIASERSFPKAILADYRVEQTNPETKKILINATALFSGELFNLPMLLMIAGGGQFNLDRDKSRAEAVYSNNGATVVRMSQHYASPRGMMAMMENPLAALFGISNHLEDSRSLPIKLSYTMWFRDPKSSYMPRVSDPRIGYFTNDHFSVDRFFKRDRTERFINRFNLTKKDPSAAVSEPVKPIVWTIDPSIPEQWRPYVKEGILRWNESFDKLGYRNAIQVEDAPKNDKNYSHSDGTRNVVRFTMTPDAAYAVALFRTDPLTGEILNASVTVDANFASFVNTEYLYSAIPNTQQLNYGTQLARKALLKAPVQTPFSPIQPTPREFALNLGRYRAARSEPMARAGWSRPICDFAARKKEQMALNYRMMQAAGMNINAEQFIGGYLADVVAHEVGHCLGLRHNFVASTVNTTADLGNPAKVAENGVAASVMDYTPTNVVALLQRKPDLLWNKSVGPYDNHAIAYGYVPAFGNTPDSERFGLSQIASRSGEPGLAYMTDEDADTFNPYVVRFDNGRDPLNYMAMENQSYKNTMTWAIRNLPRQNESYAERNVLILNSAMRQIVSGMGASMFIGGVVTNRQFRGDVNERPNLTPVDAASQRQALRMITRDILSMSSLDVPNAVLNSLAMDFNTGDGSGFTAPVRTLISGYQQMLLGELMSAAKADMILENEFKAAKGADRYTLSEHYGAILSAVFSEVGTGSSISTLRRELQAFAIDGLLMQAGAEAGMITAEHRAIATDAVDRLKSRLASARSSDAATTAHLKSLSNKIERFERRIAIGAL